VVVEHGYLVGGLFYIGDVNVLFSTHLQTPDFLSSCPALLQMVTLCLRFDLALLPESIGAENCRVRRQHECDYL